MEEVNSSGDAGEDASPVVKKGTPSWSTETLSSRLVHQVQLSPQLPVLVVYQSRIDPGSSWCFYNIPTPNEES